MTTAYIGDDICEQLDRTKPVTGGANRDPFVGEGRHKLALMDLSPFTHKDYGASVRATFEVLETTNPKLHPVGSRCTKMWFLQRQPAKAWMTSDKDRFADFVRKLKGAPEGAPIGKSVAALIRDRVAEQLARGMLIDALGVQVSKDPSKPYVDVSWTTVQQDPAGIAQMRARIEQSLRNKPADSRDQAPQQAAYTPPVQQTYAAPTQPARLIDQLPPDPNANKGGW